MKYLVTILFLLTALLTACNPAKRAAKQQKQFQQMVDEYIKNHPPRIDTVTKYIPGKDSSKFFKQLADSIAAIKFDKKVEVSVRYKDTCTSAIQIFNEAYETGYQHGLAEGKATAPVRVDTIDRTQVFAEQVSLLKKDVETWKEKFYQQSISLEKNKRQKNTYLWLLIAAGISIALFTTLTLKKRLRP